MLIDVSTRVGRRNDTTPIKQIIVRIKHTRNIPQKDGEKVLKYECVSVVDSGSLMYKAYLNQIKAVNYRF